MTTLEWLEALSYVVTIIGLPFAIVVFLQERRKERENDDEELYLQLSDDYAKFLRLILEHADLHLITRSQPTAPFTSEQIERRNVLFELLISIFERAYILVYDERMGRQASRLWHTWADYIREWCRRPDFRELLPELLQGEDADFQSYIRKIASEEADVKPDPTIVLGAPAVRPADYDETARKPVPTSPRADGYRLRGKPKLRAPSES